VDGAINFAESDALLVLQPINQLKYKQWFMKLLHIELPAVTDKIQKHMIIGFIFKSLWDCRFDPREVREDSDKLCECNDKIWTSSPYHMNLKEKKQTSNCQTKYTSTRKTRKRVDIYKKHRKITNSKTMNSINNHWYRTLTHFCNNGVALKDSNWQIWPATKERVLLSSFGYSISSAQYIATTLAIAVT
jgi:hypothetical protein